MSEDRDRLYDQGEKIGEINGKIDSILRAFDHHMQEEEKFQDHLFATLRSIEADINKAKGAKAALLGTVGVVAAAISTAVTALGKML